MGNRTAVQLVVFACPPDQTWAVRQEVDSYGLTDHEMHCVSGAGTSGARWEANRDDEVLLNHQYLGTDISCGSAEEIAASLEANAPGAVWVVWEDPKYEWMGDVHMFAPSLGKFRGDCDSNGTVQLTNAEVRRLLDRARKGKDVGRELGEPWEELFQEMREELPVDYPLPVGPHPDTAEVEL